MVRQSVIGHFHEKNLSSSPNLELYPSGMVIGLPSLTCDFTITRDIYLHVIGSRQNETNENVKGNLRCDALRLGGTTIFVRWPLAWMSRDDNE